MLSSSYCNFCLSPSEAEQKHAMWVLSCFYLSCAKWEFVPTEACGLSLLEACAQLGSLYISFRTVFSFQDVILHLKFYLLSLFLGLFPPYKILCPHGYLGSLTSYFNLQILLVSYVARFSPDLW